MVAWMRAALVSSTGAFALSGCSPDPFACGQDSQCAGKQDGGVCELNGYCSFPDPACPSGRRYGDLAGGGFAGVCVVAGDETESAGSSDATSTSEGGSSTPTSPTTTATSMTTQPVDDGTNSTTSSGAGNATTRTDSTSGSSSSTGGTLDDGLVLWLAFEEDVASANGAIDGSANGFFANCSDGQCPTTEPGPAGNAALFDGTNDMLAVPHDTLFDLETYSMTVWLRMDEQPEGLAVPFGKAWGEAGSNSYEYFYTRGVMLFNTDAAVSTTVSYDWDETHGWTHFAGTFDGSELRLYVNGGFVGSDVAAEVAPHEDFPVTIGADLPGPLYHFNGAIDEVRLYDRVLTDDEIEALAE